MLQKVNFLPGFNKQVTPTGAEGQWTGGDNVRFRYGTPETLSRRMISPASAPWAVDVVRVTVVVLAKGKVAPVC